MVLTQWETLCGLFFAFFEKIVVPILTSGGSEKRRTIFCGGKGHHRKSAEPINEYRRGLFPFWEDVLGAFLYV